MPLPETTKTITLEPVGAPEFWFKFKRVPGMKYMELMEFNNIGSSEEMSEDEKLVKRFSMLILDWNIPNEEGDVRPIPNVDPQSVMELPVLFSEFIARSIFADSEEGGVPGLPLVK